MLVVANTTGNTLYDAVGNITQYTRALAGSNGVGEEHLSGGGRRNARSFELHAFNSPLPITKTNGGSVTAGGAFSYDAGYQRIRQKKTNASGVQVDDILYVVPGGFEVNRNSAGAVTSSIATVSGPDGAVATVSTNFDPNTGLALSQNSGVNVSTNLSGTDTVTKLILKDHLGSMTAEFTMTSSTTGVVVVHGFGPWGNARNASNPLAEGQRGFTGHEHLAELGLIHMNGRIYDPVLGRFLSASERFIAFLRRVVSASASSSHCSRLRPRWFASQTDRSLLAPIRLSKRHTTRRVTTVIRM